jgi:hypothetical protein
MQWCKLHLVVAVMLFGTLGTAAAADPWSVCGSEEGNKAIAACTRILKTEKPQGMSSNRQLTSTTKQASNSRRDHRHPVGARRSGLIAPWRLTISF